MITYNDIHEARMKEQGSNQLQKLPGNFLEEVMNYFKEKKKIASKEDDAFPDVIIKTKKQLENATTLFREIIRIRRKKILNLVLIAAETGISKQDFDNMFNFEKTLFEDLMKGIETSDKGLSKIMSTKIDKGIKNEQLIKISFRENVGEFVGLDGKKTGGFKKGETATLPREIAQILMDDGKAEVIEK